VTSRIFLLLLAIVALEFPAKANDEIFPATGSAAQAITWKNGSFVVNGKPVFLASGEVHYARVPRELWRDRLWRMKMMGLNTVQTYVFWNAQEGREGEFNFSDNLDLDAWLTLVESMGMYAIVRPGPYNCAEWESGGLPAWLTVKPGMQVREDYPAFVKAADQYLSKVYPIIAKHQINRGGSVLMVQLENEYPGGLWGTDGNPYLKHIYGMARKMGLEVPLFYSGLHHGNDPAGETPFAARKNPWYSTEFWTGWIGQYGDMAPEVFERSVRGTWKIIAFGGAGYDYYVVHGGSNFGYSRGSEEGAAYDYSAPIGQQGQLRKVYFPMRRASSFATTFSDLLARSVNDGKEVRTGVADGLRILTRAGTEGTAVFLDNQYGKQVVETKVELKSPALTFPKNGTLKLQPKEIRAVAVLDVPWTKSARFASIVSGVLGRVELGGKDYWVCYGEPGEGGEITVKRGSGIENISLEYPADDSVHEIPISSGDGKNAVFLVMNTSLADHTWILPNGIFVGPGFVHENGAMEFPPAGGAAKVYTARGRQEVTVPAVQPPALPTLSSWTWRGAAPEAEPSFNDAAWPASPQPLPMESVGSFQNGYGWYRTSFTSSADGVINLKFAGSGGDLRAFVNGSPAKLDSLPVKKGANTLAILAMTTPRPKMFDFKGATGLANARGIWGEPTVTGDAKITWRPWRFQGGLQNLDETPLIGKVTNWPAFVAGEWKTGNPPAPDRPNFWRTDFPYALTPGTDETVQLQASGLRRGQVWLNGHNLGPVPDAHPIYLPKCWLQPQNTLVIFDADGAAPNEVQLQRGETYALGAPPK
jgi:beta-galactosidase